MISNLGRHLVQVVAGCVALLIVACAGLQQAAVSTAAPSAAPSDTTRAELRGYIENVTQANARRYAATDSAGRTMDTAKIIADPAGGYMAVYHTMISGVFHVSLATSSDLLNWTFQRDLGSHASQPFITLLSNGGFVVAWEQDPNNHLAFKYYSSRANLLSGTVAKSFDAPRNLSSCAEGTPNIYSVILNPDIDHSTIDVGHHYFWNCDRDRQARGKLTNFNSWTTSAQSNYDNAILYWGVGGNIGDRDALTFKGYNFGLIEGQYTKGDFGSWRAFLYDYQTGNADTTSIHTNGGSTAFANPSITNLVAPNGSLAIVVTLFIPSEGAAPGESGELIYYRTYTNLALNKPATADSSCNANEGPAKAVNGAWNGGTSNKWCSLGSSKWLQVDLGSSQTIQRFVVRHAGDGGENSAWNTRDFTIQVSNNGSAWTTVVSVSGNTANLTLHQVSTSGRYARLNITTPTSNGDPAARIYEFEVYGN
jgi:F5/8 type C domain